MWASVEQLKMPHAAESVRAREVVVVAVAVVGAFVVIAIVVGVVGVIERVWIVAFVDVGV